jgi:hypothetical protein
MRYIVNIFLGGSISTQTSINDKPGNISINKRAQQEQVKSSGYKGLILTTALVLGASSLLISNYQSIKVK